MPANTGSFAALFDFTRARSASYTDADGVSRIAPVNTPRLDHDADGAPLGLLIQGRPTSVFVDRLVLDNNLPGAPALGTILHDYITKAGERRMLAIYTHTPRATLEARLAIQGHHRRLAFFPQFLERSDLTSTAPVRFGGESWEMAGLFLIAEDVALDVGDGSGALLIEA